jgi:hypothetical protein
MKAANQIADDDCLRACVASIFEMPAASVPLFWGGGRGQALGDVCFREWCERRGAVPIRYPIEGASLDVILGAMQRLNPDVYFILCGTTKVLCGAATMDGTHAVVCAGGRVVHDPSNGSANIYDGVQWSYDGVWWQVIYFADRALAYGRKAIALTGACDG